MKKALSIMKCLVLIFYSCGQLNNEKCVPSVSEITPPKPPSEIHTKMKQEVEDLLQLRMVKISEIINQLSHSCIEEDNHRQVIQLSVNPEGIIESYEMMIGDFDTNFDEDRVQKCLVQCLKDSEVNLGRVKIIPNARNGSRPQTMVYTIIVKRSEL